MKKLLLLALLIPTMTFAQSTASDLRGLGMSAPLAERVSQGVSSSTDYILGTDDDAQRKLTFAASSDTAMTLKFGDATASQALSILGTATTHSLILGASAADITITDNLVRIATGTVLNGAAGDWDWTLVNATDNQACTTGCGISACIFGFDSGAATLAGILGCDGATADLCFCTGPAS